MSEIKRHPLGKSARLSLIIGSALALTSCLAGPDYQRPELTLPGEYHVETDKLTASSLANVAWFDLFGDPELTALIDEALANNLDLLAASARVDEASARVGLARSGLFPRVDGVLDTTSSPQSNSNDSNFTLGLLLNWEVDLFGKIRRSSEAARARLVAQEAGRNAVISALVNQVAGNWLILRELDDEERIIQRNIEIQTRSLELVKSLHRYGVVSNTEEQQARAQLANTKAQLPEVQRQQLFVENTMIILLGRWPDALPRERDHIYQDLPPIEEIPLGVPSDVLARRPDVVAAEALLHAATATEGVAIANRFPFPTIGLRGFFGGTSSSLDGLFDDSGSLGINSWGPTLSLPILNFGQAKSNVEIARAQTRQALYGYKSTIQQALVDVSNSVRAYETANARIVALQEQEDAARETLRLQDLRFKGGVTDYLEVLDSQRQLLSAELALARARLDRDIAWADIYKALGGGWEIESDRGE